MIRVYTPATSANLGPGFDTLGMAFNLHNVYEFNESKKFEFFGFADRFSTIDNNLVAFSYNKAFAFAKKKPIPVSITLVKQDIPSSRGLGSSSSCIIAGIMAANYYLGNVLSTDEVLQIAVSIEGHPDNVTPCLLGGLVACIKDTKKYIKYPVSDKLLFNFIIPNFPLSTSEARSVLPRELSREDIIFNLSRVVNIPYAFEYGDLDLLNDVLEDKIHVPYRYPLISKYEVIYDQAKANKLPMTISGAGPTLLVISKDDIKMSLPDFWEHKVLNVDFKGSYVEVIK